MCQENTATLKCKWMLKQSRRAFNVVPCYCSLHTGNIWSQCTFVWCHESRANWCLSPVFPMHSCCVFSRNTLGPHNSWLPQSDVTCGCCHDLCWICSLADYRYSLLACPHQTNHSSNPLPVRAWARWARCCVCVHISASECLLLKSSNSGMRHQIAQQLLCPYLARYPSTQLYPVGTRQRCRQIPQHSPPGLSLLVLITVCSADLCWHAYGVHDNAESHHYLITLITPGDLKD